MINFKRNFLNKKNIMILIVIIFIAIYLFLFLFVRNNNKIINLANFEFDKKIYLNILKLNDYNKIKITEDNKIKEKIIKEFSRYIEKKIEIFSKNFSEKINLLQEIDFKFDNNKTNTIDLIAKPTSHYFENKKTFLFEIVDYRKDLSKLNINYIFTENINLNNINDELKLKIILPQIQKDTYFKNLSLDDIEINLVSLAENKIIIKAKPNSCNFKNQKEIFLKRLLKLPINIDEINTRIIVSSLQNLSKNIILVKEEIIQQLKTEIKMSDITLEDIDIEMNLPENKIIIKSNSINPNFKNQKIFHWEIIDYRRDLSKIVVNNIWLINQNIINSNLLLSIKKEILSQIKKDYHFSNLTLDDVDIEIKTEQNKIIIKAKKSSLNFKNEKTFNLQNIDNRIDLSKIKNEKIYIILEKINNNDHGLIEEIISQIKQKNKLDNFNSKEIDIKFLTTNEIIVKPNAESIYFKNEKILKFISETIKTDFKNIKLNNVFINEQNLERIDIIKFEIISQIKNSDSFFSDLTLDDFDIELKIEENKIIMKAKSTSLKFKYQKILNLIKKKEKKDLKQLNIEINTLKISEQNLINEKAVKIEIIPQIQKLDLLFFNLTLDDFDIEIETEKFEIIIKAKPTSPNFENEKKISFLLDVNKKDLKNIKINHIYASENNNLQSIKSIVLEEIKKNDPFFFNLTLDDFNIIFNEEKNKIFVQSKDTSNNFERQKILNFHKISLKTDLADIKINYIFINNEQDLSINSNNFQKFITKIQKEPKFNNLNLSEIDIEFKKEENKIIIKAKPTSSNFKNEKTFFITYNNFYDIKKDLRIDNFSDIIVIKKKNLSYYDNNKKEVLKQLSKNDFFSDLTLDDFDIEIKKEENKIIIKAKPTSSNFKNEKILSLLIINEKKNINELTIDFFNLDKKNKNNLEKIKKSLISQIKNSDSFFSDLTLDDFDIELKEENKIIIKAKPTSSNFKNEKIFNLKMIDDRIDLIQIKNFEILIKKEDLENENLFKKIVLQKIQLSEPQVNSLWNNLTIDDFEIIKNLPKTIIVQALEESNNYKNKKQLSLKFEYSKTDLENLKNLKTISLDYKNILTDNYHDPNFKNYIKETIFSEIKKITSLNDLDEKNLTLYIDTDQQSMKVIANENNKYLKNSKNFIFVIDDPRISLTIINLPKLEINYNEIGIKNNYNEIGIKNKIMEMIKKIPNFENISLTDFKIKIDIANKTINVKAENKSIKIKEEIDLKYVTIDNRKDLVNLNIFNIEIDEKILIKNYNNIEKEILSQIKKDSNFNDLTLDDFDIELKKEENKIIIKAKPTSLKFKNEKAFNLIIKNIRIDLNNISIKDIDISKKYLTNSEIILKENDNIKKEILSQIKKDSNFNDLTLDDFNIEISEEHLKNQVFREFCYIKAKPTSLKFKNEKALNIKY
ncbi:MAG: hypothetical protein ACLTFB_01590 [Candidatus Phytoplasma pyri]